MTVEELRTAIRALFASHPAIAPSPAGHVEHAERYRTSRGANIGFEPTRVRHQNIFVEAAAIDLSQLIDIPHRAYAAADFAESMPNHDLFHHDAFGKVDLVCFKVTDLWQAVRVVAQVAGPGRT